MGRGALRIDKVARQACKFTRNGECIAHKCGIDGTGAGGKNVFWLLEAGKNRIEVSDLWLVGLCCCC